MHPARGAAGGLGEGSAERWWPWKSETWGRQYKDPGATAVTHNLRVSLRTDHRWDEAHFLSQKPQTRYTVSITGLKTMLREEGKSRMRWHRQFYRCL